MANRKNDSPAPNFNWPTDENGDPMVMVSAQASELIPLKKFANVTIGPALVTRFVPEGDESVKEGLSKTFADVEEVLGVERQAILEIVHGK